MAQGFDLAAPPLMRLVLVQVSDGSHRFIWTVHHLLLDGWSTSQLIGEVLRHYGGEAVAAPAGRYRDYIEWLQSRDMTLGERFWTGQLARLDAPTRLANALARPEAGRTGQAQHRSELGAAFTAQLAHTARREHVTVNTLVQAAWVLLLSRYTGQQPVVFGATVAGRPAELAGAGQMLGLFINTLPMVASLRADQPVGDWLRALQAQNLASREHEHTPLYEIQRWAGHGGQALFDSIVVFENYPVDQALREQAPGGLVFGDAHHREETNYPMTVTVGNGESMVLGYTYARDQFGDEAVIAMAGHVDGLLRALTAAPSRTMGELQLPGRAETAQLDGWSRVRSTSAEASSQPLHATIEAQARARPDAVAVVYEDASLSYGELNARANRLAHRLIALGVRPETRVGLAVERSLEMVVGLLAILKAGGAYVPLDPQYPADRLAYMVAGQRHFVAAVAAPGARLHRCPRGPALYWISTRSISAGEPATDPGVAVHADNLAYVIYTSGSTGRPKGAQLVRHRRTSALPAACDEAPGLSADDVLVAVTSLSFDFSVLGAVLAAGARGAPAGGGP
jgi:non-ribosomal peptide synthetase component F